MQASVVEVVTTQESMTLAPGPFAAAKMCPASPRQLQPDTMTGQPQSQPLPRLTATTLSSSSPVPAFKAGNALQLSLSAPFGGVDADKQLPEWVSSYGIDRCSAALPNSPLPQLLPQHSDWLYAPCAYCQLSASGEEQPANKLRAVSSATNATQHVTISE